MKKPILIVEDDSDIRESLVDILEDEGYTVHSAVNGKEGIDILSEAEPLPGLVLLDLMMPVLDGMGFRKLQLQDSKLASIPTVLFSADGQLALKAENAGVKEFIKKPVSLVDLMAMAQKYCEENGKNKEASDK